MQTYKHHGTCQRYQGSAYPVQHRDGTAWAAGAALDSMRAVDTVAFAAMPEHPRHDRVFSLVTDGESWGVRCELARGFPGEWPHIELAESEQAARADFAATVARYSADPRWTRRA